MNYGIGARVLLLTVMLGVHNQWVAAQGIDTLNANALREVTVVGRHTQREVIPVQQLSGKEFKGLSAYSVADAIRYFAGTQIKDYGGVGGLKSVNVRSLGSQHVGVFYDGIELGNAQNGIVDLGRFSLDLMEAVSLYNGQKSSIFQPAKDFSSASAIYMRTRRPYFEDGKTSNMKIGLKGGSFETINPSIVWERAISNQLSLQLSGEYMQTSGRYRFSYSKKDGYDTTEVRRNGDVKALRIEATLFGRHKQTSEGNWMVKAYLYNSERGYPGASVREEPGVFSHQDRQWDNSLFIQGQWQRRFASLYSLQLNAKYANDYLHYLSDPRLDVSTMYVDNTYRQQETYLSAAHLLNVTEWFTVSVANDVQWNTLNSNMAEFSHPTRLTLLSAISGAVDTKLLKIQASLLHSAISDHVKFGRSAGTTSRLTPSIVASASLGGGLSLRAFAKQVFRMPTFNDLYYTFVGNKDLNPETATQYNIGGVFAPKMSDTHTIRTFELQLDAYLNHIDNKIVAMPTSNQFRWTMINLGRVQIAGVDASAETDLELGKVWLHSRLTYTYQKAEDRSDRSSQWYRGQIPYTPWHSGSAIVGLRWSRWSANYSFIYTGERYESQANIEENHAQPWYTSDLGLNRSFPMKWGIIDATIEINNILNQQYEVVKCYPMPGRNWKLKLQLTL